MVSSIKMFRATVTWLLIFNVLLSHGLEAARHIEVKKHSHTDSRIDLTKRKAQYDKCLKSNSRQKRGLGAILRGTLTAAAWAGYGLSIGSTLYHAIQKCNDYKPDPCESPACRFINPCPDLCQNPEKNREYIKEEKEVIKRRLDLVDTMTSDAFAFATDAQSAITNNKIILISIDKINMRVDELMINLAKLDEEISENFWNKSEEIKALVRNQKTSIDDIVASPLMVGIFDKWTWGGTGRFVLSLTLTVGWGLFAKLQERYAVYKLYSNMKTDFSKKFINQRSHGQAKFHNKFAYVTGYTTNNIDREIKKTANAVYKANQANTKVTRTEKITRDVVGPAVNAIYIALSAWSVYKDIHACQKMTDKMQTTAIEITEEIMKTKVEPLQQDVATQAWKPVIDLLTNETVTDWLESIRNVTLETNNTNLLASANTIKNFNQNIGQADVPTTILLQKELIAALKTTEFQFACLADKQNAVTIVINDCKSGRDDFSVLYTDAHSKYDLNRKECVDKKVMPYTSQEQLKSIVNDMAKEKGWYSNCLLNDNDLLDRICSEKAKGYTSPVQIVTQVNKSMLTEDMVLNFLTRCSPPKITPKSKTDTCTFYCLYQTPQQIASIVGLSKSQVDEIIKMCEICTVRENVKTEICALHFCEGENSFAIEIKVRLPLITVNHVISKCVQKCIVDDIQQKEICNLFKCKSFNADNIAKDLSLPLVTINEVSPQCDIILPKCGPISDKDRTIILSLQCNHGISGEDIYSFKVVELSLSLIQSVINSQTCKDYKNNGLKLQKL